MSGSEGLETEVTSRGLSSRLPSLLLSTCREKHHKTIRPKGPAPLAQWPRGLFSLSGSFLVFPDAHLMGQERLLVILPSSMKKDKW